MSRQTVKQIQANLAIIGCNPGLIDGIIGPRTRRAIVCAKKKANYPIGADTPAVDTFFIKQLRDMVKEQYRSRLEAPYIWINYAHRFLGLHERFDNKKLAHFLRSDGFTVGNPRKFPWCGDFIETVMSNCAINYSRKDWHKTLRANPYWARNWAYYGKPAGKVYGAVGVFSRGPRSGHVAFLIGERKGYFRILGGNQSNRVNETWIAKRRLLAARWPAHYHNPKIILPKVSRNGKVYGNND